ncbi:MAG: T9SS type A sorting domain-containing protein [Bacteroidota bacterium]
MKHTLSIWLLFTFTLVKSQTETFPTGSYIVNMGVTSQTVSNGLKPYGLVFELLKTYQIPVKWVIGTSKMHDSTDFTYNSKKFKGGTFIIPRQYVTSAAQSRIYYWRSQGVVLDSTNSTLTVNVTKTLTSVPNWSLNSSNSSIAASFFSYAGLPTSAYNSVSASALGACNDIFMMPHADPTWSSHGNLYNWNRNYKGTIWAGCHSVSVLESLVNPSNSAQQMNFLSTTGLINYNSHNDGSTPFQYYFNRASYNGAAISARPDDPVFQFMGTSDAAHTNGSEQVYIPLSGGAWRNTTKLGIYDSTQSNVSSFPNGPAAISLYGRGFGLSSAGYVMYQAGHNISGTSSASVAAMRQFFNFSLMAMADKVPAVTSSTMPSTLVAQSTYTYSVAATSPVNSTLSYQWSATCGGTFSNPNSAATSFVPGHVYSDTICNISCVITDSCSRYSFVTQPITVLSILPVNIVYFDGNLASNNTQVELKWGTANEENLNGFEVLRSVNGNQFENIATIPAIGQAAELNEYTYLDQNPIVTKSRNLFYKLKMVDNTTGFQLTDALEFNQSISGNGIKAVYPNPAGGLVNIELNAAFVKNVSIEIVDMFGRVVYYNPSPELGGNSFLSLDINHLTDGLYVVNVRNASGSISSARFVKK